MPYVRSNRQDLCVELNGNACLNEFIVINNRKVVRLPQQLPLRQGALFWLAACCMRCVERMQVQTGQTVLIHGAGSNGLMLLQLIRKRLPRLVVVSDPLPDKRELARQMGADVVLDPYQDQLKEQTLQLTNGFGFDHIVDASGAVEVMSNTANLLCRGGRLMLYSNYRPGNTVSLDLADIYWKEYTVTSCYNPTYAPYTANADFMIQLDLEHLIGAEFPLDEVNEAFKAYATHRYQRILIHL